MSNEEQLVKRKSSGPKNALLHTSEMHINYLSEGDGILKLQGGRGGGGQNKAERQTERQTCAAQRPHTPSTFAGTETNIQGPNNYSRRQLTTYLGFVEYGRLSMRAFDTSNAG